LDHRGDVSVDHFSQRARPAWIIEGLSTLSHIGDAVFHLDKDIRAVIHTQSVACAEVLVYPYAHGFNGTANVALACGP
jgi:hypothetical protein